MAATDTLRVERAKEQEKLLPATEQEITWLVGMFNKKHKIVHVKRVF